MENWKDIEDYKGLYQVSDLGRVKSLKNNKILKNQIKDTGYYVVSLCKNGQRKTAKIHRLVAQAFIPNENNLPMINHKDENKLNNNIDNLEWCDNTYNVNYGTAKKRRSLACSKPIICIETGIIYSGIREATRITKINRANLCEVCNNNRKTAGGYHWQYI